MKISFSINISFGRWTLNNKDNKKKNDRLSAGDFLAMARKRTLEQASLLRPATIRNFRTAMNCFFDFIALKAGREKECFDSILVDEFAVFLSSRVCPNTASCYLRSLRSLYNSIVDKEKISNEKPFQNVNTSNAKTMKRALPMTDIRTLADVSNVSTPRQRKVIDTFLFSVYAFGLPFVDLYNLRRENISHDTICYRRQKTGQQICVPIVPEMRTIIYRYAENSSPFLFPFLHKDEKKLSEKQSYSRYQNKLSTYNRELKKIAISSDANVRLTSYVARHTWATMAMLMGIDTPMISQAMGHTSLRTTQIYLGSFPSATMRQMAEKISRGVNEANGNGKVTSSAA